MPPFWSVSAYPNPALKIPTVPDQGLATLANSALDMLAAKGETPAATVEARGGLGTAKALSALKENDEITLSYQEALYAVKARKNLRYHFLYLPFPIAFFLVFAATALTHVPVEVMFPTENGLATTLVSTGTDALTADTTMKFKNIQTRADVFPWLTKTLFPALFVTTDYNGNNLTSDRHSRIVEVHKLLGAVEITTTSAEETDCGLEGPLGVIYKPCHDYDNPTINVPIYIDSNADAATAIATIVEKQASGTWITPATTSLVINIATYNGEVDLMCITTLQVEFQIGGFVATKYKMASIPADPYHHTKSVLALDIVVGIFFVATLGIEVRQLWLHRRSIATAAYWGIWRVVEWGALAAVLAYYVFWAIVCDGIYDTTLSSQLTALEVSGTIDFSKAQESTDEGKMLLTHVMERYRSMGDLMVAIRLAAMVALFLLTIRILGSFRFHPRLNMVTATLGASLHSLGPFFFVFVVCLAAFVVSGCLLFGEKLLAFSTIGHATVTVVDMLFGQFDLAAIFDVDYHVALVWYWCAMIVLFLVLFNMLLAIVLAAFDTVREEKAGPTRSVTEEFSIIAKELIGVEHFWHHDAPKRFRQSVRDGNLQRFNSNTLSEHLHIGKDEAKGLIHNMKVLSVAGADLDKSKPKDDKSVERLHDRIDALERAIASLVQQLQLPPMKME
ncbi:hypothetical protein H310_09323 [Aphanomyces invadans]|uniref:Polycystin cation channel PKD1/PKD2 domain-containing protein n=1 Tax=Aphanomyces invadans TaxID=157072 RepID=A0A024TVH3_9STRA|nr:hypothetical protein H310_09323 [Aphanomyces invadans]ETV98023.1 hypothetical protein H310_09323 [Aphanomyces invadans]|eukprot:XP_008873584.1 hypothetical protein H310_09323 [Aphanomyces invadans]